MISQWSLDDFLRALAGARDAVGGVTALARALDIPLRTIQDWISGARMPNKLLMRLLTPELSALTRLAQKTKTPDNG